jgi:hypothetical protein
MKNSNKYLLILIFIIFIGFLVIKLSTYDDSSVNVAEIDCNDKLNTLSSDEINAKFHEIRNIPFNEVSMNCKNKSELFAAYLKENGAKDINIIVIVHDSTKYSHEFVEWNEHFYDTCNNQILSYKMSKEAYLQYLQKIGFNGVTISSPYET